MRLGRVCAACEPRLLQPAQPRAPGTENAPSFRPGRAAQTKPLEQSPAAPCAALPPKPREAPKTLEGSRSLGKLPEPREAPEAPGPSPGSGSAPAPPCEHRGRGWETPLISSPSSSRFNILNYTHRVKALPVLLRYILPPSDFLKSVVSLKSGEESVTSLKAKI